MRHSTDSQPGYARHAWKGSIGYVASDGRPIDDKATVERIRSLAIPPAWTDVWICADPWGHLQATGRDARQRKQYRYHPLYRARRDRSKFDRMLVFGSRMPRIRRVVDGDLARSGLPHEKVVALVVRLLELTAMRVGNEEYARTNRTFGLTTLRSRHVTIDATGLRFRFKGKGGRTHTMRVRDRRLAGIVRRCQGLPGQQLFEYVDAAGSVRAVHSDDVNDYLRRAAGVEVTAKDFRTWYATVLSLRALRAAEPPSGVGHARSQVARAMEAVAGQLGNTPTVCRSSYVHPGVIDAYLDLELTKPRRPSQALEGPPALGEERALLRLLRRSQRRAPACPDGGVP